MAKRKEKKRKEKKESRWFKAPNTSKDMQRLYSKFGTNIVKPHAIREKTVGGKRYEQVYHKPIQPGEFWD
jgi:hypothetical protein